MPEQDNPEDCIPEYLEPAPPPVSPEETFESKDSLAYYLQPYVIWALAILFATVIVGLIFQAFSHQDNWIAQSFWEFVRVVSELLRAFTDTE